MKRLVQINGPGLVPPWDGLIDEVARRIEGVRAVEVIAEVQPLTIAKARGVAADVQCGAVNSSSAEFCEECAAPLSSPSAIPQSAPD